MAGQNTMEDVTENNDPVKLVNAFEIETTIGEHENEMSVITESLSLVTERLVTNGDKINDKEDSDHDITKNFELVTDGKVEMEEVTKVTTTKAQNQIGKLTTKVVVTSYLRLRNEFKLFPANI